MQKLQEVSESFKCIENYFNIPTSYSNLCTCIFNRIRQVTHMTRDIHDIILYPSDSVLVPNGYFFNWHMPTRSLNMTPNLVIPANVGITATLCYLSIDIRMGSVV